MPKEILDFLHFVFDDPVRYTLLWVGGMILYVIIRVLFDPTLDEAVQPKPQTEERDPHEPGGLIRVLSNSIKFRSYHLTPKVTKRRLCENGVAWCIRKMGKPPKSISIKLNYARRHGRRLGMYRVNGEMILYINHPQHQDLKHLANTIIHEYTHALQFTSRKQQLSYDNHTARLGYYNNPFEVEARAVADRLENELFEYWKNSRLIIKQ